MSSTGSNPSPSAPFWVAQLGPDVEAAREFYAALFGWTFENIAGAEDPPFLNASTDGGAVASLAGPIESGTWIMAVAVPDLAEARRLAVQLGGEAPGESTDIAGLGWFHRLADPAGTEVHVVEPFDGARGALVGDLGAWASCTLSAAEPASVGPFYESLFGWRFEAPDDAGRFVAPGGLEIAATGSGSRTPYWTPGFGVDDVDEALAVAVAHGGTTVSGPRPAAGGARHAVLTDPGGARLAVHELRAG